MTRSPPPPDRSPAALIDERIASLGDWRGETLRRVRTLIRKADPDVVEAWKWRGTPVWEHDGIVCTGETYKAIDIHEGETVDARAFTALVRAAVAFNASRAAARRRSGG